MIKLNQLEEEIFETIKAAVVFIRFILVCVCSVCVFFYHRPATVYQQYAGWLVVGSVTNF